MCSDFCSKRPAQEQKEDDITTDTEMFESSCDEIFDEQYAYWQVPSDKDMEESRLALKSNVNLIELKELISDVQVILNRVADKAHRLIGNFTTNLAESWMGIRSKFDGGKVINRCGRGCYGGALRKNLGIAWSPLTFQTITGTPAGVHFFQGTRKQAQKRKDSIKYQQKPESQNVRRKRKHKSLKDNTSKKAKLHYGSQLNDAPDVTDEKLSDMCQQFFDSRVNKDQAEISNIKEHTANQSTSQLCKKERKIRLTSSNFGKIMKRRTSKISNKLVKNLLYTTFTGNIFTIRGLEQEANTIIEYQNQKKNETVEKVGLQISYIHPFLAASADGLVTESGKSGLLEIKIFLQTDKFLLKEAVKKVPNFCLELIEGESKLKLKENHDIFYQSQGQMNIFEKEWCDFVIRRTNPYDIHIERVHRDELLWKNLMVPKLEAFYFKFVLPELALPRFGTYTGIRQPKSPWYVEVTDSSRKIRSSRKTPKNDSVEKSKYNIVEKPKHDSVDRPVERPSEVVLQQPFCSAQNE